MLSMTGFGRASVEREGLRCDVELRSVNHRFIDLKLRLPRALGPVEPKIKRRFDGRLRRGRVEITAQLAAVEQDKRIVEVDLEAARALVEAHQQLADACGIPKALDTAILASAPGVLTCSAVEHAPELQLTLFEEALEIALATLLEMRAKEGEALEVDIRGRLATMQRLRGEVATAAPARSEAYQARLLSRLEETLAALDIEIDEGRVLQEVALFAEKTDIAEELSRLESHIQQAEALMEKRGAAQGRRLDFLCQEMFREVNTIGSKAQDAHLAERVIDMKAELERLREQVQNVE